VKLNNFERTLIAAACCALLGVTTAYAAPANMPAEITTIRNGTEGYISGICYIVGTASAAVGVWKFVESQSLKVAALAGTVTVMAFKFPTWVIAAAVI
jgi:hypothetical protein